MKLRIYSDIHLDHYAHGASSKGDKAFWYPPELPDDLDTTLILAGDLWIGTRFIEWAGFSWIGTVANRFKQVIVVLGNHDYWPMGDLTVTKGGDKCNALLADMHIDNVIVLDCDTFMIEDVMFVGATLWTDMNNGDPLAMYNMTQFMTYDGKCKYITGANGEYEKFSSFKWVQTHTKHRDYIKYVVEQNRDKKIIVITHHLPLASLGDPRYIGDNSNCYYSSDLSNLILDNPHIVLWCYGHTHHQKDTMMVSTRLINNCVGYAGEQYERQGLVKHKVIEI
jgi:predicted phosphohydrolase